MSFEIGRLVLIFVAIFVILTAATVPSIHSFGERLSSRTTTSIPVCIVVAVDLDVFLESSFALQSLEVDVSL